MFVNIGLVGVFSATELIYAVYKANKGGFDSLIELYTHCMLACSLSRQEFKYLGILSTIFVQNT